MIGASGTSSTDGKGRATSYSNYYKNNTKTPADGTSLDSSNTDNVDDDPTEMDIRKKALKRRLKLSQKT